MTRTAGQDRLNLSAPDGRQLEVLLAGPPDGLPLVFHNGTPCGLAEFGPMTAAASARGLRTVLYSRPGYGGSTRWAAWSRPRDVGSSLLRLCWWPRRLRSSWLTR